MDWNRFVPDFFVVDENLRDIARLIDILNTANSCVKTSR
jgi:hypothetical protein